MIALETVLLNTFGTPPTTACLCVVGYTVGHACARMDGCIGRVSVALLIATMAAATGWWAQQRGQQTDDRLG